MCFYFVTGMFDENQLFVVFKFEESGCDLESFKVLVHTSFVTFTIVSKRYSTFFGHYNNRSY